MTAILVHDNAARPATGAQEPFATLDMLAETGDARFAFLRAQWFAANDAFEACIARRDDGSALAALPLCVGRRMGPFAIKQIAGSYWPFRSIPMANHTDAASLAGTLEQAEFDKQLGTVWRLGPVSADDQAVNTLKHAARSAGWHILTRPLGTCFELDLGALAQSGAWPSAKTRRKNGWRKRRLGETGEVCCEFFTGTDWMPRQRKAMAEIEKQSWLGKLPDGGNTKFRDCEQRKYWENLCNDPGLAEKLFGSLMYIGETPAAFTFGVQSGDCRYYIANNYDDRFTKFGPGRVLLYEDFANAAERGIALVSWGLGDAGYKTEMGARPGPDVHDLLFVRNALLACALRRIWER